MVSHKAGKVDCNQFKQSEAGVRQSWTRKGLVFENDSSKWWSRTHAQTPVVDKHDDFWRIFHSSRDVHGKSRIGYFDVKPGIPEQIVNRSSEPILELGVKGGFDEDGMMPTSIISLGDTGRKLLYYIGWQTNVELPFENSIGLAVSEDGGSTFVRHDAPILAKGGRDRYFTGTFHVHKNDDTGKYLGYYLSCFDWIRQGRAIEPVYDLKMATSSDGYTWEKSHVTAIPLGADEGGIASASIIRTGSFNMWFSARKKHDYRSNPVNSYKIGFASSADGQVWHRNDDLVSFETEAERWESGMMAYPNVTRYEDMLFLFYNGNGFGSTGIGYLTLPLNAVS